MNLPHLRACLAHGGVDTEGLRDPRPTTVCGYRLRTNYVSTTHGAAACNMEPEDGSMVEGVVMEITPVIRRALRIKEGWPHRYREVIVEVLAGDRRNPIKAITYVVAADHRRAVDMPVIPR